MSDNEDQSSSSSSSSGSSSPPSPLGKSSPHTSRKNDSWSGSDQESVSNGKPPKISPDSNMNNGQRSQGSAGAGGVSDDESSSSSSSDDEEDAGNKSASSSSESSDHDDDKENNSENEKDEEEDEDGEEAGEDGRRSSAASRSRSVSANSSRPGSHSPQSDQSDSERETGDIKKLWENDPDFYGVRRSSRTKLPSKPPKLVPQVIRKPTSSKSHKKAVVVPKKKRQLSEEDSSDEEVSRSVRKRPNAVVSYKEQESDDGMSVDEDEVEEAEGSAEAEPEEHVETIEKIMDIREGKKGATGSGTTVYVVAEQEDPNETLPADTETETQFLVKWATLSHLHNTWESLETLKENNVKGLKKLDNYCKREDELNRWKHYANPEDVEYYECQLELQQDLAKSYTRAERIIAEHRSEENEVEYFVKWDCLPYSDATWEKGSLIASRNPEIIEIYKRREASNRTPASSTKGLRVRPKFVQIKTQPDYMSGDDNNLVLRDYQLDGLNWLVHSWCKENSVILADEMGLGKTIQTICFLSYLFETHNLYGPFLLVVPLSTMAAWQKEFGQWAPQINVVTYLGDISSRDIIRDYEWHFKSSSSKLKFNAVLTTYEIVLKDKQFLGPLPWAILLVDEAHRLKNGDSLLYKSLQEFNTNHRLLITGTPLQNSLRELWSLLHFIMPHKFDDWESFEQEHDHAATKGYARLHKQLEPFILRRVKKDVEKSLPAKVEQILRVEMTSIQKQYYKWILTKNYTALRKGVKGSVSSFVNVVMELKKCCNHASLVKPIDNPQGDNVVQLIKGSGKLMLLDKLLVRLRETGHRVLIFSQMVRMLDIIAEYLQQKRFAFQRLDGGIKGDLRKQALDHFNAEGSTDFCFLLSTRAGGLGINLATADTVIIFDSDWNPQNDLQAQARAHRIGQKNQVNIYRLVTKNSVEEDIVERAKQKMVLDHLVIQRMDTTGRTVLDKGSKSGTSPFNKDELNAILKFGAEELFKEDENEGEDQCDIDEILRRAETHEDAGVRPGDELLSAFKVASFNVNEEEDETPAPKDWDSIIPEDVRMEIEAQEREKEMADLYLPPRSSRTAAGVAVESTGNAANNKEAVKKIKRKRKREANSDESESDSGRPKKRGRPKAGVKGFTDNQIRKFIKSFKRFPKPLSRIELIAKDSGLTDKPIAELKKLGEQLIAGCEAAITDIKTNLMAGPVHIKEEAPAEAGADGKKKREKGPMFKVSGINVNARTLSIAIDELKPLAAVMPEDPEARKAWKFELKAKTPPYDVDWGPEEDTKLLLAVWEYGTGAWEAIRESDPVLKEKIFLEPEKEKKPQLKHAQSRAEYLMKVIKKHLALTEKIATKKPRKVREKKVKSDEKGAGAETGGDGAGVKDEKHAAKEPRVRKPKKAKQTPMHITAGTEPVAVDVLDGLVPKVFNECKEKMRPVKSALKSLDNPDTSLSEKEQFRHTRGCLISIGDQIQKCLDDYTDEAEHKKWKSHLWFFVAKFTEYDAAKLYKLYKKASKKNEDKPDKEKGGKHDRSSKESSKHHHSKSKKENHDEDEIPEAKRDKDKDTIRNLNDNSNSSHSLHNSSDHKGGSKLTNYERDRKRERFARQMGEIPDPPRVPPPPPQAPKTEENYASPSISPKKFPPHLPNGVTAFSPGVPGGPPGPSPDFHSYNNAHNNNVYRGERGGRDRERDRAPGDPRDRVGRHATKGGYRNDRDNYDRDRGRGDRDRDRDRAGPGPDRGGRGWNQPRSRWGPPDSYNGPRRNGPYYGSTSPNGDQAVNHFGGGVAPYGVAAPSPSSQHPVSRIAPPMANNWRRPEPASEMEADMGINARQIAEDSPPDPRRRRELY